MSGAQAANYRYAPVVCAVFRAIKHASICQQMGRRACQIRYGFMSGMGRRVAALVP